MATADSEWMETADIVPMFPTLVWKIRIAPARRHAIAADVFAAIHAMRRDLPPLPSGQAWQSSQALHQRPQFQELAACIDRAAAGILRFLKIPVRLEITACWANVLAPGAGHRVHSHPNNFLSGVYYLATGPGMNTINFHDPRPQTGIIRPPVSELTAENTDQVVVTVADGDLLLFPAYLQHSVDAHGGGGERVSVSFNLMFPAFTEQLAKPLW